MDGVGGCHVKWDGQERFTEKLIFEWRLDGGCLRKEISGQENSTAEAQGQKHVWPVEPGLEMGVQNGKDLGVGESQRRSSRRHRK